LVTSGIDGVYPTGLAVAIVDSVKTNTSSPFAQIIAKPVAGIQNHRQVLILSGELNDLVAKDIQHTLDTDANGETNKNKKNKLLRKHNGAL